MFHVIETFTKLEINMKKDKRIVNLSIPFNITFQHENTHL